MKKYDSYKDSGFDWIGEVPSSWSITRLKFVGEIMPSGIDKKSKEGEQAVLLCNYVDVYKNDYITKNIDFMIATASDAQISRLSLIEGDVIATKDSEDPGDIGVPALVKETLKDIVCGYHLTMLRANKRKLIGDYLYWCVLSNGNSQYFETEARGVTRYAIGTHVFNNLRTPLPPLKEQTQIANYLDHKTTAIDQLIEKKEKLITLLKEERTAVINQAVTKGLDPNVPMKDSGIEWLGEIPEHWEVKKMKYVCKLISEKTSDKPQYIIALENIESWSGKIIGDPYDNTMSGDAQLFQSGDILFNKLRPYLAKVTFANQKGGAMGELLVLRPETNITSQYLFQRLRSEMIITIVDGSTYGTKMPRASWEKFISNIEFGVPPLNEQIEITNYLQKEELRVNLIIDKTEQEIELLKEYKTALISEVVTGKVDVRNEKLN